uniref:ribosomal protein L20 n=1 Tax=Equisetum scirpoides TaxID=3261 RepID=UPI0030FE3A2A|nr:ribosomal protein L20 [Equisetum ramosissimum]
MTRVKRGFGARQYRKKILKFASSFKGAHSKIFRTTNQQVLRALTYSYRDRNNRKRDFRRLWITRINATARKNGMSYNNFISFLYKNSIYLNRKTLAQMAILDNECVTDIIKNIKN